ncbi:MAG: DinB family protein [Chloroflexota bacterium]
MNDRTLRKQLAQLLEGVGAHMPLEEAVADFPDEAINDRAPNCEYSPWQLLEHIRLTQLDILDYIRDRDYKGREWPREYWAAPDARTTPEGFRATVDALIADRGALRDILLDDETDIFAVIPNTPGHTILREIRIVADHNAYHVGEFAVLRQVMGTWPMGRED